MTLFKESVKIILALLALIGFVALLIMDKTNFREGQYVVCSGLKSSVKEVGENHLTLTAGVTFSKNMCNPF